MALIDELRYPWPDPIAHELHRTLVVMFPVVPWIRHIAELTELRVDRIAWTGMAFVVWAEVLNVAAQAGKLRDLVQVILNESRMDHPARAFLATVLAGTTPGGAW